MRAPVRCWIPMTSPTFELVIGKAATPPWPRGFDPPLGANVPERAVHEVGQADIVVAVGGDGTIMRVARQVLDAGASSRILGVSGGRLGSPGRVRSGRIAPVSGRHPRGDIKH